MNLESVHEENAKFVLARLKLAQSLLEESDRLPGWSGYDLASENEWWRHPRHERESLVNYLLLTCFDRLGQTRGFTTFKDWLSSKRKEHVEEREKALQTLKSSTSPLVIAASLAEHHQEIYGVRNSFYKGIESLSEEWQKRCWIVLRFPSIPYTVRLGQMYHRRAIPLMMICGSGVLG